MREKVIFWEKTVCFVSICNLESWGKFLSLSFSFCCKTFILKCVCESESIGISKLWSLNLFSSHILFQVCSCTKTASFQAPQFSKGPSIKKNSYQKKVWLYYQEKNLETCKLSSIIILRLLFNKSEIHVANTLKFLKYPFLGWILTQ